MKHSDFIGVYVHALRYAIEAGRRRPKAPFLRQAKRQVDKRKRGRWNDILGWPEAPPGAQRLRRAISFQRIATKKVSKAGPAHTPIA